MKTLAGLLLLLLMVNAKAGVHQLAPGNFVITQTHVAGNRLVETLDDNGNPIEFVRIARVGMQMRKEADFESLSVQSDRVLKSKIRLSNIIDVGMFLKVEVEILNPHFSTRDLNFKNIFEIYFHDVNQKNQAKMQLEQNLGKILDGQVLVNDTFAYNERLEASRQCVDYGGCIIAPPKVDFNIYWTVKIQFKNMPDLIWGGNSKRPTLADWLIFNNASLDR